MENHPENFFANMYLKHSSHIENVGDELSMVLYQYIVGREAPPNVTYSNPEKKPNLMMAGSILQFLDSQSTIWGAGAISQKPVVGVESWEQYRQIEKGAFHKPKKVYAVRGPLSRKVLLDCSIPCPKVYGDPAILMPRYFNPERNIKYKLGVVLHFNHHPDCKLLKHEKDVLFISPFDNVRHFIRRIMQCGVIASSSLHGLILADAYHIQQSGYQPGAGC